MAAGWYMSRRRVATNEWSFDVTLGGVTFNNNFITLGNYYPDGELAVSIAGQIEAILEALYAAEDFSVYVSTTTWKMNFNCSTLGADTWSITFDEQAFAEWVGFVGAGGGFALTNNATVEATNVCQGLIVCDSGRSEFQRYQAEYGMSVRRTTAGSPSLVSNDAEHWSGRWQHAFEPDEMVASPYASGTRDLPEGSGTTLPWAWEDFLQHHCSAAQVGQPFRVWDVAPTSGWGNYDREMVLLGPSRLAPPWGEDHSARYWIWEVDAEDFSEP